MLNELRLVETSSNRFSRSKKIETKLGNVEKNKDWIGFKIELKKTISIMKRRNNRASDIKRFEIDANFLESIFA